MNDTTCPLCNFLAQQRRLAFIKREYKELARYELEHEEHRARCVVIQSDWYKALWGNTPVVVGRGENDLSPAPKPAVKNP